MWTVALRSRLAVVALAGVLIAPAVTAVDAADTTEAVLRQRFADLHKAYLAADGKKYTPLLRATLRHARRLEPAQCATYQAALVDAGNAAGYDGLEPVWLVYQDCASAGSQK